MALDDTAPGVPPATHAEFARLVGERVRLRVDAGEAVELELVEATALGTRAGGPASPATPRAPFSLLFLSDEGRATLPQQIYRLESPRLGAMEIFLVPLGPDAQRRQRYEAIFA